jgi:hypothetical protein
MDDADCQYYNGGMQPGTPCFAAAKGEAGLDHYQVLPPSAGHKS